MPATVLIPKAGFVGESVSYRTRVGVWLTPDNEREGTLEHFLETLCVAREVPEIRCGDLGFGKLDERTARTPRLR